MGLKTSRLDAVAEVLRECLGAAQTSATKTSVSFAASDGTNIEVYGDDDQFHRFFDTGPVVGFEVDDFDACREALRERGIQFLTEIQQNERNAWQHFRLPDGTVAEIIGPRRGNARRD